MAGYRVGAKEAYHHCDPEVFSFETTAELDERVCFLGQERALEAVDFGVGIRRDGFNLFAIGAQGSGRHTILRSFMHEKAGKEPAPEDWCYVNNFRHPHKPLAIQFPSGECVVFRKEMYDLIDTLRSTIPAVFEGEDYQARITTVNDSLKQKIEKLYHEVEESARADSIAFVKSDHAILFTPMDGNGKPLDNEAFLRLPKEVREQIEKLIEKYQEELQQTINQISVLKREAEELRRTLKKQTAEQAVSHLLATLKGKYSEREKLVGYLNHVEENIIERVDDFLYRPDRENDNILAAMTAQAPTFEQYEVNMLVSNGGEDKQSAPVVYEDLPTYQNLHGRIEHKARMGVLTTHFSLIKPGSLHRANGGYLIIDARRLLMQPYAYEGLKRTLRSRRIHIEPIERLLGLMSTVTLEPEPVPLDVKVVLIGEPSLYYLLMHYDPEFRSLFKVQADFEETIGRDADSQQLYGALLATIAREDGLLPLHKTAVARMIEQATRMASDSQKMSLRLEEVADLIKEADHYARGDNKQSIDHIDVQRALTAAKRRGGRIKDRYFEAIDDGIKQVQTSGESVGQVNGLSVLMLGSDSFGIPTRITALARPGEGEIVDIEREVELGGPLHSKGVMILAAFLSSRYARDIPLGLKGSLVFEQSYGGVEGDSASCAELCALLSAIATLPINQSMAITGSVSQRGEVQAIGGVNEKIEGYFDVCHKRGLTGQQAVIIPHTNVRHLMLRQEVVDAIDQNRFHIHAVTTVDEAMALLMGMDAGVADENGHYPEDTINGRVDAALRQFAHSLREFNKKEEKE